MCILSYWKVSVASHLIYTKTNLSYPIQSLILQNKILRHGLVKALS